MLTGVVSISAGADHSFAVKNDGSLWAAGRNGYSQLGINDDGSGYKNSFIQVAKGVSMTAAGLLHSFALKADGTLLGIGYNAEGSPGTGDNNFRGSWTQVLMDVKIIDTSEHSTVWQSKMTILYGLLV